VPNSFHNHNTCWWSAVAEPGSTFKILAT
jgi:hypothetical protein